MRLNTLLIPQGSQPLAPGRCASSAPGVTIDNDYTIPKGSQHDRLANRCDPFGIETLSSRLSPGALLRSDPGLIAWIPSGSGNLVALTAWCALLLTGCPLATESTGAGVGSVAPPAAQVLAQATPEKPKEEPKKVDDANPDKNLRPKADRTPRKPGDPIKITFDHIILGMQADIPFRPWMMTDEVKDLEGQRVSITGVMYGGVEKPKGVKKFILLRNKECKYGPGGQADHLAHIEMKAGQTIDFTIDTVRVEGILKVAPETGKDGNTWSLYTLADATAKVQ